MEVTWKRLTAILCTMAVVGFAVYDGIDVEVSGNIDSSVSQWFAQFQNSFVPVFCLPFLLAHFFIPRKVKLPAGQMMTTRNFWITISLIAVTVWDVIVIQFFNPHRAISNLTPFRLAGQFPQFVIAAGYISGLAFGWMTKR